MLGLVRDLAHSGQLTIVIITHKLKEVAQFVDEVTVLRRGRVAGAGAVRDLGPDDLTAMMIGEPHAPENPNVRARRSHEIRLEVQDLQTAADGGRKGLDVGDADRCTRTRSSASPACPATARRSWWRCWAASARRKAARSWWMAKPTTPAAPHRRPTTCACCRRSRCATAACRR